MRRRTLIISLFIILVIVGILNWWRFLTSEQITPINKGGTAGDDVTRLLPAQSRKEASAGLDGDNEANVIIVHTGKDDERNWGREPFLTPDEIKAREQANQPQKPEEKPLPEYKIDAVLEEGGQRLAVINHKVIAIGNRLGEEEVVDVTLDGIKLRGEGGEREIRVAPLPSLKSIRILDPQQESNKGGLP